LVLALVALIQHVVDGDMDSISASGTPAKEALT
jgi:hypothetical protein